MAIHPLVGHIEVESYFQNALAQGRLPHACLLQGPKGVGKATFAQTLACLLLYGTPSLRELNPQHRDLILNKTHPECLYIQAAPEESLGVEAIRDIPSFIQQTSQGWKVVILDSIDALTANAANALLKSLEEPPVNTCFLLLSHMPGKLLPTIKSRCHAVSFYPLQPKDMESVIHTWKPELDAESYTLISHLSQGSLGIAQQFLETEEEIIVKITNLFTSALDGQPVDPSTLDKLLKDNYYPLAIYLITFWCQQITYYLHQQTYFLPVGLFPQNLLDKISTISPACWIQTVYDVDQLIQQQEALKLDTKHVLLTLLYQLGKGCK